MRVREVNYDKFPTIQVPGIHDSWFGWSDIFEQLKSSTPTDSIIAIECYHGFDTKELEQALTAYWPKAKLYAASSAYKSEGDIDALTRQDVTDDRIFGFMTRLQIDAFFEADKVKKLTQNIKEESGLKVIYGIGASQLHQQFDTMIYIDMARWEIQQRMRRQEISSIGVKNADLEIARLYKRAYFVDWRVCDRIKKKTINRWDYVIDANRQDEPKMIRSHSLQKAMDASVAQPFRVVPFFDPGPWGGQWMRKVCDLDPEPVNFAWCFDCVPEENSVVYDFGGWLFESPSINLVFFRSKALMGQEVYARFGDEFPIRFDFLDTMDGGNLSLQVHPLTQYIQEHFGVHYTQDESYYLLDAGSNATVYLGMKTEVDRDKMMHELRAAQSGEQSFDAEQFVEVWPAKKHDHFLIPAGTIHCSGANSMVLEISATPYIFTFKLWDWGRLGLDGLPRPINIDHGERNIQWERTTEWVKDNLVNRFEPLDSGEGWRSERTGLHETEFIETIRHWFTKPVQHNTQGTVHVLNLVEGSEAIIESPSNAFAPFVVHYAETFIIPAETGEYTIRPFGSAIGKECATIKAFVRSKA